MNDIIFYQDQDQDQDQDDQHQHQQQDWQYQFSDGEIVIDGCVTSDPVISDYPEPEPPKLKLAEPPQEPKPEPQPEPPIEHKAKAEPSKPKAVKAVIHSDYFKFDVEALEHQVPHLHKIALDNRAKLECATSTDQSYFNLRASKWVQSIVGLQSNLKVILMTLAAVANDQYGWSYYPQTKLSDLTGIGIRQLRRNLERLEEIGLVYRSEFFVEGYQKSDFYIINFSFDVEKLRVEWEAGKSRRNQA